MANRLIVRELTSIGLVPEGDNPAATIEIWKRKFNREQRDRAASMGQAMPDGSFPIVTVGDLRNAVQAYGRASNPAAARRHITKRARALGRTDLLPEGWGVSKARTGSVERESHQMDFLEKIEDDELRAEVEKALDERDAAIAELRKDDEPESADILKDADEATRDVFAKQQAELAELRKQADEQAAALVKEREARELEGFVAKAREFPKALGEPGEAGAHLQKMDPETRGWLLARAAVFEKIEASSDLMKELGVVDGGDAKSQIETLAKEKQVDNPDLSDAQARALVRTERPDLKEQEREEAHSVA